MIDSTVNTKLVDLVVPPSSTGSSQEYIIYITFVFVLVLLLGALYIWRKTTSSAKTCESINEGGCLLSKDVAELKESISDVNKDVDKLDIRIEAVERRLDGIEEKLDKLIFHLLDEKK